MESRKALYITQHEDTLGSVALKFRVDPEDLSYWNELDGLRPEPGTPLMIKSDEKPPEKRKALPVVHRVRRGDTFLGIAKKYGISVRQLKRWNRRVNPRRLQIGQRVRMYIPGRDGRSVSYGSANRGRLYNGVALETTTG